MKLDYNILWIDDRPRQVESAIEHVRVRLARKGFDLNVKQVQQVDDDKSLKRHFANADYDLLVVDYRMQPGARDGSQLIRSIRRLCDSTDIVFYSSDTPDELRGKINVDGVYCVNRNDLGARLDLIIHSTIKKVFDLNHMRGISLSQIADFDHIIEELICLGHARLDDDDSRVGIVNQICDDVGKYHLGAKEKIESLSRNLDISAYTSLLGSSFKYEMLTDILTLLDEAELDSYLQRAPNYRTEVIEPRNKLAHSMEKERKNGKYVLQNSSKEVEYSQDDFTALRIKLLEYRDMFSNIKKHISN
jgi:CheY-like chemotaxis protein